jgi:hypothetical protein
MTTAGGGWTLVMVSSDDGTATWTQNNAALLTTDTTVVGTIDEPARDFKSRALHSLQFRDLLFVHQPSAITAVYGDVGDGSVGFAAFLDAVPYPNCGPLDQIGHAKTGGTLALAGQLCTTAVYFNPGDRDEGVSACLDLASVYNSAAVGPVWSASVNDGCPLDDPSLNGFGPENDLCANCGPANRENVGRGFGRAINANAGTPGAAENYLQMWIR